MDAKLWGLLALDPGERVPTRVYTTRRPKVWHASRDEALAAWQRLAGLGSSRRTLLLQLSPRTGELSVADVLGNAGP